HPEKCQATPGVVAGLLKVGQRLIELPPMIGDQPQPSVVAHRGKRPLRITQSPLRQRHHSQATLVARIREMVGRRVVVALGKFNPPDRLLAIVESGVRAPSNQRCER
ncbi:MAG: hypothetical protein ACKV19_11320, partial [Verrucomicrobiales bacterium]